MPRPTKTFRGVCSRSKRSMIGESLLGQNSNCSQDTLGLDTRQRGMCMKTNSALPSVVVANPWLDLIITIICGSHTCAKVERFCLLQNYWPSLALAPKWESLFASSALFMVTRKRTKTGTFKAKRMLLIGMIRKVVVRKARLACLKMFWMTFRRLYWA